MADVAVGQALLRDILLEVGRGRHAQRHEQAVAHDLAVLDARHVGDDAAQDPVAQVGVVEDGPRRPRERRAGGQQLRKPVERKTLLAIAPRVVRRQAGRHREQLAQRHRVRVGRGRRPVRQLRYVGRHGVVQTEAALVAQQQDRRRREGLGHRRDPEHGVGIRHLVLAVADRPRPRGMDQLAVTNHAPGDARDALLLAQAREAVVDGAEGVVERRHRVMMPGLLGRGERIRALGGRPTPQSSGSGVDHSGVPVGSGVFDVVDGRLVGLGVGDGVGVRRFSDSAVKVDVEAAFPFIILVLGPRAGSGLGSGVDRSRPPLSRTGVGFGRSAPRRKLTVRPLELALGGRPSATSVRLRAPVRGEDVGSGRGDAVVGHSVVVAPPPPP